MPNSRKAETNPPTFPTRTFQLSCFLGTGIGGADTLFYSATGAGTSKPKKPNYFIVSTTQKENLEVFHLCWCYSSQQEHSALAAAGFWGGCHRTSCFQGLSGDVWSNSLPNAGPTSRDCAETCPARFEPLWGQRFYNLLQSLNSVFQQWYHFHKTPHLIYGRWLLNACSSLNAFRTKKHCSTGSDQCIHHTAQACRGNKIFLSLGCNDNQFFTPISTRTTCTNGWIQAKGHCHNREQEEGERWSPAPRSSARGAMEPLCTRANKKDKCQRVTHVWLLLTWAA